MYIGKEKFSNAYFLIYKFFNTIFEEMPKENFEHMLIYLLLPYYFVKNLINILIDMFKAALQNIPQFLLPFILLNNILKKQISTY